MHSKTPSSFPVHSHPPCAARCEDNAKIERTVVVAGGGEEALTAVSTLLARCSRVGGNLNQLARHFNSGGADTEQLRAKLLDEQGKPKLRESYILDTLECGEASFATACLLANRKYDKNNHPDDIKSHQYIISFDPRDAVENGLTMEKAQALGLNSCKENFPGHPAIVCTHPDGRNHSGNIHVHIVIGSVRTREGVAVKESRGRLSYCPPNRVRFITARKLNEKFEKEQVLAALAQNIRLAPTIQPIATDKPDRIQKPVDIQAKLKQGKGIGYERWAKKHNLKAMADNKKLRSHAAAYKQYRPLAQKLNAAKSPAAFEEQHRAELTAYRAAAAYLKANNVTSLPSPNKLEAEYCALASEKAQFYEQYKEAKSELLKLKDAKQNVALFFREEKQMQHHEREGVCV